MIAVISDIHSNLAALQAVLNDIGEVENIWVLGDLVGYGPNPNEVLDLVRPRFDLKLCGNHDQGSVGLLNINLFTSEAKQACLFTRKKLNVQNTKFLKSLEPKIAIEEYTLVHASPREPSFEYILNFETAFQNFKVFETPICFVGHTHIPVIYKNDKPNIIIPRIGEQYKLSLDDKVIINPGSVGQPRDGNPKSSYILFDRNKLTLTFKRVEYDIKVTQKAMQQAGLPENLIERLEYGF